MSVNAVLIICVFASWFIEVDVGCRHPEERYWPPLGATTTAALSLPQPEIERQCSLDHFWYCIFGNLSVACGNNSDKMCYQSFQPNQCLISLLPYLSNECQWSVNNVWSCRLEDPDIAQQI